MTSPGRLATMGTSPRAIRHHYDLSDDFFRIWLGPDMVYSCGWWDAGPGHDSLAQAQQRKLDFFADRLGVRGGRVLDVGCGWGALLERFVRVHGAASGVGLTLSPSQAGFAARRDAADVSYQLQNWVDHQPDGPYDAITCIEATEHFASETLSPDEKVEVYRAFFERAAAWLRPGGRMGLQLICLDNVGHAGSRPGRGPFSDLILDDIFPESMPASLSELVLGWETHFELDEFHDHPSHYQRTFRAWTLAYREQEALARALVGPEKYRTYARYFAAGEAAFRLREHSLYRVILTKRPEPKTWAVTVRPSDIPGVAGPPGGPASASASAVRSHYDVSNSFYELWLGPSMMYSSAMWAGTETGTDLERAQQRKIDFFADRVLPGPGAGRILDVGCGWGWNLRRLTGAHRVTGATGLTLSQAQLDYLTRHPVPGADVRLEDWNDHEPVEPYDGIFSFGAFEHFAQDGTTGPQRIAAYRRFFRSCAEWLAPGGRLGLETIAHDGAPDTDAPLGRGPLGDFVLSLYPESICPHLGEIVLGFEPYFELEMLRSDPGDFARTCRLWLTALREHEREAAAIVGEQVVRQFRRYLASSEIQFRTRTVTNYRLVLHRRPGVRI
ncbi:MAG TPA: class I SAM-dependent methyltransferase [Streptosporangiaceae bacterium]|nr:class I SAM-dependent methyltransferase [Streptosporangiaceae bacterium]